MKSISYFLLILVALLIPKGIMAQNEIRITKFEENPRKLEARTKPMFDNNGDAYALICFEVRDNYIEIEPNMGYKDREDLVGQINIWVPKGTKRITFRREHLRPYTYNIPLTVESKKTYDAIIEWDDYVPVANKNHYVYMSAGYNILSLMGPSVAIGANINHHNIELSGVYGLNKTDDLYFYDTSGNANSGFSYRAVRVGLSYGYELAASDFFSIMPQLGGFYQFYNGKDLIGNNRNTNFKNANAISVFGALRFTVAFSNSFKMFLAPEYDFVVYKDEKCKLLNDYDNDFKNWNTGFNLNVGLQIFF